MNAAFDFADMDDLASAPVAAPGPVTRESVAAQALNLADCKKCRGAGRVTFGYASVRTGTCYACKGTGKVRANYEKQREAHRKGEATKAANRERAEAAWILENPGRWSWMCAAGDRGFRFADEMRAAVRQYGHLTERQAAAVDRCVLRDLQRAEARDAERAATFVQVGAASANGVIDALVRATETGKTPPKIRTAVAVFSLAKPGSANEGCVYVKRGETYLGKITPAGVFQPSRECTPEARAAVAAVVGNALEAAVEYGKTTGVCSCCGRELTDPVSVAAGIGPVCAQRFFR
jgi:hypothetical protein